MAFICTFLLFLAIFDGSVQTLAIHVASQLLLLEHGLRVHLNRRDGLLRALLSLEQLLRVWAILPQSSSHDRLLRVETRIVKLKLDRDATRALLVV